MKTRDSRRNSCGGMLAAVLLVIGVTARSADTPTLKDAYKDYFYIGTVINRSIATGTPARAGFSNRTLAQVQTDVALVKEQFNQIVAENDLKWLLIHPRECELLARTRSPIALRWQRPTQAGLRCRPCRGEKSRSRKMRSPPMNGGTSSM